MKRLAYILCLTITIISCKNSNTNSQTNIKNEQQPAEETTALEVTENTENLSDSIQIKHIQVGAESPDEKVKFHASYPSTMFDFINAEEEAFVRSYYKEFEENAKNLDPSAIAGIDYGQHFELVENSANYITFLIERYTSFGNNYDIQYFTHIYDLENKKQIQFSDLFAQEDQFSAFAALTRAKAEKTLKNKLKAMKGLTQEDQNQLWKNMQDIFLEGTKPQNKNYHAFSWDKDGNLTLYFDKYQIASGDFGNIKITLSKEEYQDLLSPDYQNLMHYKSMPKEEINLEELSVYTPKGEVDCGKVPCVALTFDDGPSIYTPKLLDILKENDAKATFFVLGKSAEVQKNTILRIHKEGHQIGNHSWDHKDLKHLSKSNVEHQIYDTNNTIQEIIGESPHLMRPPYGSMNATVKEVAKMPIILWNLDPLDWKDRNADIVAERMSKANKNGIVLAHDIHKTTVQAIPSVIKALKEKGYHLVTIDELFAGQELKNGVKYSQRKNK